MLNLRFFIANVEISSETLEEIHMTMVWDSEKKKWDIRDFSFFLMRMLKGSLIQTLDDKMWTHANYLSLSLHHHPACGRGFYKSSSQDLQCSRCPAHSFNDREGSWRCDCEDGYYRALSDPPSVPALVSEPFVNLWSSTFPFLPFYICRYIHKTDMSHSQFQAIVCFLSD